MNEFKESKRGLYRSRNGKICGVCAGIAEYFDFSVFWIRIAMLFILFASGIWPAVLAYFVIAMIMKPSPVIPIHSDEEREFYDSYASSTSGAAERLKNQFDQLNRRIHRMEDAVTARAYEWDQKLNS